MKEISFIGSPPLPSHDLKAYEIFGQSFQASGGYRNTQVFEFQEILQNPVRNFVLIKLHNP